MLIISFQLLQQQLLYIVHTKQQQMHSLSCYLLLMFLLPPGLSSISDTPVGPAKNGYNKEENSGKHKSYPSPAFLQHLPKQFDSMI